MFALVRRSLPLCVTAALLLAGCQTARQPGPWTSAQVAALTQAGFVKTERGWEFSVNDRLLFPTDEGSVDPGQATVVTQMAQNLLAVDIRHATIEGHTDRTGTIQYNLDLSKRRADSVAALFATAGFPPENLRAIGLGESYPVDNNTTAAGRRENRRVVVLLAVP
jgi:outer membrane protein OmpA-like peptidoglycan-associated protein